MTTLTKEIYEIPQIKLYNNLVYDESGEININEYLGQCNKCKSSLIKKYVRKIVKNYEKYKSYLNEESYVKYCKYFIYWLYREKKFYITMQGSPDTWNGCISCVWGMLEQKRNVSGKKCEFENVIDSFAVVQIMKLIDDICAINTQTALMNGIKSNKEKCIEFNKKRKNDLGDLFGHLSSIPNNIPWNERYFNVEKSCSDKKIYDLFAEIDCPPDESAKCPEQKECDNPSPKIEKVCSTEVCKDLNTFCKPYCALPECEPKTIIKTVCPEQPQHAPRGSEEQQINSHKNPYLQLPVTVFSSVIGTIFFFLFLYKFTPFRTWFLNRIGSKKTLNHKMRQDMEREYLGVPFQPPYGNDQNNRPRVGYSQNER
ncbi:PIR protein [Plasmodium vivax]|nr:PIR protein [Plasmodium vivax]